MTPAFASWNEFFAMGGFGRALGDAASRNSAWCGATAGA